MKIKTNKLFNPLKAGTYMAFLPNLKQEENQQKILAITLVAISFFGLFAINPTLSTIAKLKKELKDNKFVDAQLVQKIDNISKLQKSYADIENDLNYVTDAVPVTAEPTLLAAQLEALSQKENISIANLQISEVEIAKKTEGESNYNSFSFSFSIDGSLQDDLAFVSALTNMQRSISLESISLNQGGNQANTFQVNIKGTAYFKN